MNNEELRQEIEAIIARLNEHLAKMPSNADNKAERVELSKSGHHAIYVLSDGRKNFVPIDRFLYMMDSLLAKEKSGC